MRKREIVEGRRRRGREEFKTWYNKKTLRMVMIKCIYIICIIITVFKIIILLTFDYS